jgi:hypothetical protein
VDRRKWLARRVVSEPELAARFIKGGSWGASADLMEEGGY